jgi:hypothetical protein
VDSAVLSLSGTHRHLSCFCFFILFLFFSQQPNVYVTPTPDMAIKPRHKHVDIEGKCYLPALSSWHAATSNIVSVIGELQGVFAVNPPVFAKPQGQAAVQPPSNPYAASSQNPSQNKRSYGSSRHGLSYARSPANSYSSYSSGSGSYSGSSASSSSSSGYRSGESYSKPYSSVQSFSSYDREREKRETDELKTQVTAKVAGECQLVSHEFLFLLIFALKISSFKKRWRKN